jgi:membrane protein required for beta-lactamase induction
MIFLKQESSHYLPIDKTNKMKAAKKFFTRVALTMIAIFVFESIYNWNESETPL